MGFTLRAVLDVLPFNALVTVAELVPAVIQWNRATLAALAGNPLRDRRLQAEDVGFTLRANPGRFDVVLLDVDNGPAAFTTAENAALYDNGGVAAASAGLRPGGMLAIWSAWEDRKFEQRLRFHGFLVEIARVRARLHKEGPRHTIFLAHKSLAVSWAESSGLSFNGGLWPTIGVEGSNDKRRDGFLCQLGRLSREHSGEPIGTRVIFDRASCDPKEHIHMGDKGGKKDKAKSKQQHDVKQKAEAKRNEEKNPRKTS